MKIRFELETPTLLSKECTKELVEYAKQKVKELIAKYGVYEIYITAKPKGATGYEEREGSIVDEELSRRYWFEEELEKPIS